MAGRAIEVRKPGDIGDAIRVVVRHAIRGTAHQLIPAQLLQVSGLIPLTGSQVSQVLAC